MDNKEVTLVELLIVIVVMGIIAAFSIPAVGNIIENTSVKVDKHNVEVLEDVINTAYLDGTIIIKNNRLSNTVSNRGYSGTGTWFFDDMDGYLANEIVPQSEVAQNNYNSDGDRYKFRFSVSGNTVQIFYYDEDRTKLVLNTFTLGY